MVLRLNKILSVFLSCFLSFGACYSQVEGTNTPEYPDYKDNEQHDAFYKTRHLVSEWQIHELKKGALVVRLKTNALQINALLKAGKTRMAEKKRLETLAINLNIYFAYTDLYKFSKLYFIYTTSFDTLLKGARQYVFLDSNLVVDSSIVMKESFYLIAETDNIYNSSIGFVKEAEARSQVEHGNKTTTEALVVIKNKYGHQLKKPFPYKAYEPPPIKTPFYVYMNAAPIIYKYNGGKGQSLPEVYTFENKPLKLEIEKNFSYVNYRRYVANINAILFKYYKKTEPIKPEEIDPEIRQYLY